MKLCSPPPANTPKERLDNQLIAFLHTHRTALCRYYQSCGMFNGHPRTLFLLRHHPGMTQRELAQALQVAAPTLSVSIRRMEAAGLVERRADPADARCQRLYLTADGEALDHRCAQGREFLIDALYEDFSEEDIGLLDALLTRMTANLERATARLPETDPKGDDSV